MFFFWGLRAKVEREEQLHFATTPRCVLSQTKRIHLESIQRYEKSAVEQIGTCKNLLILCTSKESKGQHLFIRRAGVWLREFHFLIFPAIQRKEIRDKAGVISSMVSARGSWGGEWSSGEKADECQKAEASSVRLEWQTDTPHAQHLDPAVTLALLGTAVWPTSQHLLYVSGFYDYHEHNMLIAQTARTCIKLKILHNLSQSNVT